MARLSAAARLLVTILALAASSLLHAQPPPLVPSTALFALSANPGDDALYFPQTSLDNAALDSPPNPPPGFYATLEVGILRPNVKERLVNPVAIGGDVVDVTLPMPDLDWVASPRVRVGYRLPDCFGEYVFSYRTIVTDQSGFLAVYDGLGNRGVLRSYLNVQAFDLDYANVSWCWNPLWQARWAIGVRIPVAYFDVEADSLLLRERVSNHFVGAGPHGALEVERHFAGWPAGAIFGRAEGATALGYIRQSFERVEYFPVYVGGSADVTSIQYIPMFDLQFGLSWTPPTDRHWLRFTAGYEYEAWYYVGRTQGDSRANLFFQGFFARGEWRY
jgi:hypothetical protein